jgi:hypothetical protein
MKRIFILLISSVVTYTASAQKFMVNGYSAYVFDDGFSSIYSETDYYEGKIQGSFQWGAGVEYLLHPHASMELLYLHQNTTAPIRYQFGVTQQQHAVDFNLDLNYMLLGVQSVMTDASRKFDGHGGILAGMVVMKLTDPRDGRVGTANKFAWGGRIGGNYWITDKFAIKLQAQLLAIRHAAGGTVYFGPSGGGFAMEDFSTIFQCGLGGGLVFRFGKSKKQPEPKTFYMLNL